MSALVAQIKEQFEPLSAQGVIFSPQVAQFGARAIEENFFQKVFCFKVLQSDHLSILFID